MLYRTCSKCGEAKPETAEFFRKRGHPCRGGLRPDCRECSAARDRAWGAANRDKKRAWNEANAEKIKQQKRAADLAYMQTENGRKKRYQAIARYVASDKGKMQARLCAHRRRARLARVVNDLTEADWLSILAEFDYECAYCGFGADLFAPLYQEHVVPIAKGGPNTFTNVVPACRSCNSRKFQTDLRVWYPRQPFYSVARMAAIVDHLESALSVGGSL